MYDLSALRVFGKELHALARKCDFLTVVVTDQTRSVALV